MGELIAFKLPKSAARRVRAPMGSAKILFFTGVRREIMSDAAPSSCLPVLPKEAGKAVRINRDKSEAGA